MDKEDMVCIQYTTQPLKKSEILPFSTTWMDLEDIMLREISQTKINTVKYHLYVATIKYNKLMNESFHTVQNILIYY